MHPQLFVAILTFAVTLLAAASIRRARVRRYRRLGVARLLEY